MWKQFFKYFWIGAFLLTLLIRAVSSPAAIEHWYSRGFFPAYRSAWDLLTGVVPFPLVYLLVFWLFFMGVLRLYRWLGDDRRLVAKLGSLLLGVLQFVGLAGTLFIWLWGFNYKRIPLEEQLGLVLKPMTDTVLIQSYEATTAKLIDARLRIAGAADRPLNDGDLPSDLEAQLRVLLESWLAAHDYPTDGEVRALLVKPKGVLMRFSSSGVYLPWVGEGHVDAAVHPIQIPFVMAHEMAHGYCFGNEGICNFIAYLVCIQSDDPLVLYSGIMGYWRYLAGDYRQINPDAYAAAYEALPEAIKGDLQD
ncbi:MAG: DUF3810 family protein, partial [Phaeodactylibacter sp.]|nr:DUF3810 family protein [Phaeodactylibacter sp.]